MLGFLVDLAGFTAVAGASGFTLAGRPLPSTLRIASRADFSYRTSLVTGFIPALKSRCLAVKYVISSFSAISDIVRYSPFNFMLSLSVNVFKRFIFFEHPNNFLYKISNFVKKCIFLILFTLTLMYLYDTLYIDRQ